MHPSFRLTGLLLGLAAALAVLPAHASGPFTFSTLAGKGIKPGLVDGTGSSAQFFAPAGAVADPAGNIYISDSANNAIRKVTPQGVVTTVAGAPDGSSGYVDGVGSTARFDDPFGLAMDAAGNLYVADAGNGYIREITFAGNVATVSTVTGVRGNCTGIAVDPAGDFMLAVSPQTSLVMSISLTGHLASVNVYFGEDNNPGYTDSADGDPQFQNPTSIVCAGPGLYYIADTGNSVVRRITITDGIGTVATYGSMFWFSYPQGVAADAQGNVYVADTYYGVIDEITPGGGTPALSPLAGIAGADSYRDGPGASALFDQPAGLCVDLAGSVYVADTSNNVVRKIAAGTVSTLAGVTDAGAVDGTGAAARFNQLGCVAEDAAGNYYVTDSGNHQVRKITPAGVVTTVAGVTGVRGALDGPGATAEFNYPIGIAVDPSGSPIYVADSGNGGVRKIAVAGGAATVSTLCRGFIEPFGLALDAAGDLFVTDSQAEIVYEIPHGTATPVALAGGASSAGGFNGVGASARFHAPCGVACNLPGTVLYVADQGNYSIRKVTIANSVGTVSTVAGQLGVQSYVDGPAAGSACGAVLGVALDRAGNVFFTEPFYHLVRELDTTANTVSTIGGSYAVSGDVDGAGASARFDVPDGIVIDAQGIMGLVNDGDNTFRLGSPPAVPTSPPSLAASAPRILSQSAPSAVPAGMTAGLTVDAVGSPNLTYQWYFNGLPIAGATSFAYFVVSAAPVNTGTYAVTVSNALGMATSAPMPLTVDYAPVISGYPADQLVAAGGTATFTVAAGGVPAPTYAWSFNGMPIPGATGPAVVIAHATAAATGSYRVVVANALGTVTANAQLTVAPPPAPPAAPVITSSGQLTAYAGVAFSYPVQATDQPTSFSIAGTAPPGLGFSASAGTLSGIPTTMGTYPVTFGATNAGGTGTLGATVRVLPGSTLRNFSVQATTGLGGQPLVVGFDVAGGLQQTLVRAVGPTLGSFGVPNALPDPALVVDDFHGGPLAVNTTWGGSATLAAAFSAAGAFPLPATSHDSAVLVGLASGAYTAQATGLSGDSGAVLLELYNNDSAPGFDRCTNLSGMARVGAGSAGLDAGLVLSGPASEQVLLRAVGPGLSVFGVSSPLLAPVLTVKDQTGAVIAMNAGWGSGPVPGNSAAGVILEPATLPVMIAAGAFPFAAGSADSAFLATLPPGTYSVQIAGANATSGVTLLEIYLLGP